MTNAHNPKQKRTLEPLLSRQMQRINDYQDISEPVGPGFRNLGALARALSASK
jgi:hypothetical protein